MEILSVTEAAMQLIRKKIIMGEFAPGEKLVEMELSTHFDISRPPLREAFRVLQQEGLLISVPRKGIYVRELSVKEVADIYRFRQLLELNALTHFEQENIRDIPEIKKMLAEARKIKIRRFSPNEYLYESQKMSLDFHRALVDVLNNAYMSRCITTLMNNLSRYIYIYFSDPQNSERAFDDHEKIFDFIKIGDYPSAKTQLTQHLELSRNNLCKIVESILEGKISKDDDNIAESAVPR